MPVALRLGTALAVLATTVACAGCGLGPGAGTGAVSVRVTRDFGTQPVRTVGAGKVAGQETDMQVLEHHFAVRTRYGGGFVQSIDGHAGTAQHDDWFFYVNGIQAAKGAAATNVSRGDHIWWDLHDWQATQSIPAVVGSFPEPFLDGSGGKRYPATLECSSGLGPACASITHEFTRMHIPLSPGAPGYGSGPDTLSINVGTWHQLYGEVAAELLKYGPGASGVYARVADGGRTIELENEAGTVVRTLGPGAGLIAATASSNDPAPTWLVTGTDPAGVRAAAAALTPAALAGHFALAVQGSARYPIPIVGAR